MDMTELQALRSVIHFMYSEASIPSLVSPLMNIIIITAPPRLHGEWLPLHVAYNLHYPYLCKQMRAE